MAISITTAQQKAVSELYVAFFNRAADSEGLGFWAGALASGKSIASVAQDMYLTAPARAYYSTGLTNEQFIKAFYATVLNRATPDAEGVAFWTAALNQPSATQGSVAVQIMKAVRDYVDTPASPTNAAALTAKTLFAAKVDVSTAYALQGGTAAGASAVLSGVVDATTAAAAIANLGSGTIGSTFTLTTGIDNVVGTAGNDTIQADFGIAGQMTVADTISAGAGTDTLKLFGTYDATKLPLSISGVEVLQLANSATNTILTTATISGLTKLQIDDAQSTGTAAYTTGAGTSLQLATAAGAVTTGLTTWNASATDTAANLILAGYQGVAGGTAAALTIAGAATTTLNVVSQTAANKVSTLTAPATVTTVNIDASTALSVTTSLTAVAATTLNVKGAGAVTIAGSDLAAIVTVDASTATGSVAYTAEAAGSTLTFKGGAGADSVTFAATTLTIADVLSGGAGSDTIVINDTAPVYAAINAATDFEVLGLATTGATVDMSLLTKINSVKVTAGNLSETITNSLSTSTYSIDNSVGNSGTIAITNKVGESATSITLDAGAATSAQTVAALNLTGATTVALVSTGTGTGSANILTALGNADNSSITITGAKDLTITNALAGVGTGSVVNASAFTGKLSVTGSAQNDILTGGSAVDTLVGGAGNDVISGNAGADNITGGTGGDTLTGGAGADKFIYTGADFAAALKTSAGTTAIDTITDFVAGTDKIVINVGTPTSMVLTTAQTITTAADLAAVYTGITAIAASAAAGALSGAMITVTNGAAAGTYLYVNDATGGVAAADDMLIKLTGLTGTIANADFAFA